RFTQGADHDRERWVRHAGDLSRGMSHDPRRMRTLVVLTQPPLPEGGAPGKTAVGLLRGLREHGVEVRAVAARRGSSVAGEVPADLPVELVDVEPPGPWEARLPRARRPGRGVAGGGRPGRARGGAGGGG